MTRRRIGLSSFAQQRLWVVDRLVGDSRLYHVPIAFRVGGRFDAAAFRRAVGEVVRRHEVLRTSLAEPAGRAVQVVEPEVEIPCAVEDVTGPELREAVRRSADILFDLSVAPLFRVHVFRVTPEDHVVLLVMHHIVCDGWSLDIMLRELADAYAGRSLAPLPIQYLDFATWQREHLSGDVLAEHLAYWRAALDGAPPALDLPTDRPRPATAGFRGASRAVTLDADTTGGLVELCRAGSATLFMGLLAGYGAVLSRWTGVGDVVVGTPVAGRNQVEVEGLIGFFVNVLPIRCDTAGDPTFRELVAEVRDTTLGAYAHQDLPFERLVDDLSPDRSLSRHPIFQTSFTIRDTGSPQWTLPGLDTIPFEIDWDVSKYDLSVEATQADDGTILLTAEYDTDLFDASTIDRALTWYVRLLKHAVGNPDVPLSQATLPDPAELHLVTTLWNGRDHTVPDRTVPGLIADHAAKYPDDIALVCRDERLTYAHLHSEARGIAKELAGLGIKTDDTVAICLDRGPSLITTILGILYAGAGYLPLDPELPPARLALLSGVADLVVTTDDHRHKFPEQTRTYQELLAGKSDVDTVTAVLDNLAYTIYTSGSTGGPKPTAVTHRALANYTAAMIRLLGIRRGDTATTPATISADLGYTTLFPVLAAGGCVLIEPDSPHAAPGADHVKMTPSHFRHVTGLTPHWRARRTLVLGGEPFPPELARRIRRAQPGLRLVNHYGPTEATIGAVCFELPEDLDRLTGATIPIGRPVDGTRSYVVDRHGRLAGIGMTGELWIGGPGIARGYPGHPDLTAERFTPDPFGPPGSRVYRTGDLVRWTAHGQLEFIGRADHQVKIRGHRVELGEIEAALAAFPDVAAAVVVVRASKGDEPVLTGYLQSAQSTVDVESIRRRLAARLPAHMVPPLLGVVDAWPMTASGKIDRKALPPLGLPSGREVAGPVEQALADVWTEVLNLADAPGARDNFFGLGGNSLNATQIVARIDGALKVSLPIRQLFETPTIEELAEVVAAGSGGVAAPITRRAGDSFPGLDAAEIDAVLLGDLG
ncbi:non-ribosomal peptide synthetase [Actinosynnema sp. CS-041913]|uniref:non-ribosomal peptide synthetase n=1 Tax=Actinosynnema sp. CS-041913 TaxID=3239917 RepID=UPI003D8C6CEB